MMPELEHFDAGEDLIITCESCAGLGVIDVGDCEDGVWETCPECDGDGVLQ